MWKEVVVTCWSTTHKHLPGRTGYILKLSSLNKNLTLVILSFCVLSGKRRGCQHHVAVDGMSVPTSAENILVRNSRTML